MVIAIFRRRLREGRTFDDFKAAWEADRGFGVPARVFAAVSLEDPRDVLTVGFVAIDPDQLAAASGSVAGQESVRHDRIDEIIEATELRAMYRLESEHDFSDVPREIPAGSAESLLALLVKRG